MKANESYTDNKIYAYDNNIWVRNEDVLTKLYSNSKLYGYINKYTYIHWNKNWSISKYSGNKKYIWLRGGGQYGCICSSNGTFADGENACAQKTHSKDYPKCGQKAFCASSTAAKDNKCKKNFIPKGSNFGYIMANSLDW